jgi:hypothetical protein
VPVDPIDEGDAFTAASLNSRFTALADDVNDLTRDNLRPRSLRDVHFSDGPVTDKALATAVAPTVSTAHTYRNEYPGYNTDTFNDPPTAVDWTNEWNVVTNGVTKARKTFSGLTLTMAGSGVAGLLVFAEVERRGYDDGVAVVFGDDEALAMSTAIMYLDSAGTWHVIPRTERHLTFPVKGGLSGAATDHIPDFRSLGGRFLIRQSDLIDGANTIHGVQLVVSLNPNPGSYPTTGAPVLSLWQYSLAVIPLHAEEP